MQKKKVFGGKIWRKGHNIKNMWKKLFLRESSEVEIKKYFKDMLTKRETRRNEVISAVNV